MSSPLEERFEEVRQLLLIGKEKGYLLYDEVNDGWADGIDAALPVLIVAGELDPVANYGEGAFHVANSLWSRGSRDVRTVVYPGVRHEIHNEPPTRALVEGEIIAFVESHL